MLYVKIVGSRNTALVNASAKDVFDYLVDASRHGEWEFMNPSKVAFRKTSEGPTSIGSVFERGITDSEGITTHYTREVTEFVPNQRLSFETVAHELYGLRRSLHTCFTLRPTDRATTITKASWIGVCVWPPSALPLGIFLSVLYIATLPVLMLLTWWMGRRDLQNIKFCLWRNQQFPLN